jgi:hypothetical protein
MYFDGFPSIDPQKRQVYLSHRSQQQTWIVLKSQIKHYSCTKENSALFSLM